MMRRWALAAGAGTSGLIALAVLLAAALLLLPAGAALRQSLAERALTHYWGEPVEVAGPVTVRLWPRPVIDMEDVSSTTYRSAPVRVSRLRVLLASWFRLPLDPTVFALSVEDGRFEFPLIADEGAAPETLLSSPVAFFSVLPRLRLENVAFEFADPEDGWRFTLDVGHVLSRLRDDVEYMDASARLNGTPITLSFQFDRAPRASEAGTLPYGAVLSMGAPGLEANLRVRSGTAAFDETLTMSLEARTSSLSDLLALASIKPSTNGKADLRAQLFADSRGVAMRDLALDMQMADGLRLGFSGGVADLFEGTGIAIDAVVDIDTQAPPATSFRDISVTRLSGHFQDGPHGLMLSGAVVETNAFAQSLREIGPIDIAAIKRDEEGQVALAGVSVQAGPEDNPHLRLNGDVKNLLDLTGIAFSGAFDIPVGDMLVVPAATAERLGRLAGAAALSDATGTLTLDAFTAEVKGSSLLIGKVALTPQKNEAGSVVEMALGTPHLAQLAPLLGSSSDFAGRVAFDGKLTRTPQNVVADGHFTLGRTEVDGRLSGGLRKDRPLVSGTLSSPLVHADELYTMVSADAPAPRVPKIAIVGASAPPGGSQLDLSRAVDVDIQLTAQRIEGAGRTASGLSARLLLEQGALRADPVTLTFGGGRISAALTEMKDGRLRAKGSGQGWPLASLLGTAGGISIAGTAGLTFDLSADLAAAANPLQSLNGSLVARLRDAQLGTGLLDLAGLGIMGGLFNSAVLAGESRLRCARIPLRLTNGVGQTDPAIVAETENVEAVAHGTINLARDTVDLVVVPRPLGGEAGSEGYAFTIKGPLAAPEIALGSAVSPGNPATPRCE